MSNVNSKDNEGDSKRQVMGSSSTSSGYRYFIDQDFSTSPVTRRCGYCETIKPLECFCRYPCCWNYICRACLVTRDDFCGECITKLPTGNSLAWEWVNGRSSLSPGRRSYLQGRIFVTGQQTYFDELLFLPIYQRLIPPSHMLLDCMNPTNVQLGVNYLEMAAEKTGDFGAMLDLADVYATEFPHDPFQKDKKKAEYWFQRALGEGNTLFPLAFTRYGLFLKFETRFEESKNMFHAAAHMGHASGQYEYACCLLNEVALKNGGTTTSEANASHTNDDAGDSGSGNTDHNIVTEALKWLCKASENGYCIPSYVLLAKTIIETSEKVYGTAQHVGASPLPRALQMLALVDQGGFGWTEDAKTEAKEMLDRYDCKLQCSNCGVHGTEENPLTCCAGCGVVAYCSRVCQRRHFRDGHKFDCCPRDRLFDFHLLRLTLPWVKEAGREKGQVAMPPLKPSDSRTLMQMVEDDTDEVYGEDELDYDEHLVAQLMVRMRKNLETYLNRILREHPSGAGGILAQNLVKRIDWFSGNDPHATNEFAEAMHSIRKLGNKAAHLESAKLDQQTCREAVKKYRHCKEGYEYAKSKAESAKTSI